MSHKNLTRLANANTKFLSEKNSNEKPAAAESKGLLNRSVPVKIKNNEHISVRLRDMVRKAMT